MNYKNGQIDFMKCSNLAATSTTEIDSWYDDLQSDYRKFLPTLISWSGIGYGVMEDKKIVYTTPEQAKEIRNASLNHDENLINTVEQFMSAICGSTKEASSAYGIFYGDYNCTGKAKLTKQRKQLLENLLQLTSSATHLSDGVLKANLSQDDLKELLKKDKQLETIPCEQWEEWLKKWDEQSADFNQVWSEVSISVADPRRAAGNKLASIIGTCRHPKNYTYCCVLMKMLSSQVKSLVEKYNMHVEEIAELREKVEKRKQNPLMVLVCDFADELLKANSGLSKYVFTKSIKETIKPNDKPSNVQVAVDILKQPKYKSLIEADYKAQMKAYNGWKQFLSLSKRREYPLYPNLERDYKVPVGQSNLGKFKFTKADRGLNIEINDLGTLCCQPSHYFSNLEFSELNDEDGNLQGYNLTFWHRVKTKNGKRYSPKIQGTVREIGLQRRNGKMFVGLQYKITHSAENFRTKVFFQTADPEAKFLSKFKEGEPVVGSYTDVLPDQIKFAGIDLNITNPVCITKGIVGRNTNGPIKIKDYGEGFLNEPIHLLEDNSRCASIKIITRCCNKVKSAIREYKTTKFSDKAMSEETMQWLSTINIRSHATKLYVKRPGVNPTRTYIQEWIKKIHKTLRRYKADARARGYSNISEMIRLVEAEDAYKSLISSYERIHLKPNESLPQVAKFDNTRANFKLFTMRRIAWRIVLFCIENNITLLFIENLDTKQDKDSNTNSLARMFSGRGLVNTIQETCLKYNIATVLVDKRGTSKTDSMTGLLGLRSLFNKQILYVLRNGEIVSIDADNNASANTCLRGINHSVCPYKFYIPADKDDEEENNDEDPEEIGARLKKFFKDKFGTARVFFIINEDGTATALTKKPANPFKGGYLYYRNGIFLTEELHRKQEEEFKTLCESMKDIKQVAVIDPTATTYKNFNHLDA